MLLNHQLNTQILKFELLLAIYLILFLPPLVLMVNISCMLISINNFVSCRCAEDILKEKMLFNRLQYDCRTTGITEQ
jgi:hypothetical protein